MDKLIMRISCLAAGPIEFLLVYLILGKDTSFFKLMGLIVLFSIVARVLYTTIFTKLIKVYDDILDTEFTICIWSGLSYFLSSLFLVKVVNDASWFSAFWQCLLFVAANAVGFMPSGGGGGGGAKSKSKKITATTYHMGRLTETTYRDENGDKVGEARSFDYGCEVDTTIKDKDGNETKIEHFRF